MTDQMEKLFADLRAETLPTVRPPGTGPLRTAARRRRAAISGAAAVAVLATAGLVAVTRPGDDPVPVAAPASTAPWYPETVLAEQVSKGLAAESAELSQIFTDTSRSWQRQHDLLGGTYELRLNCFGAGSAYVTATTGGEPGQVPRVVEAQVLCEAGPRPYLPLEVVVPEPSGRLNLTIEPEVAGPAQAAVGYALVLSQADKSRWQQAATAALGAKRSGQVADRSHFVGEGYAGAEHTVLEAGRYRVRAVCLGFGTITLSAGSGRADDSDGLDETMVRCSPADPEPAAVTYTATQGLTYSIAADYQAGGRSAVATVLERY